MPFPEDFFAQLSGAVSQEWLKSRVEEYSEFTSTYHKVAIYGLVSSHNEVPFQLDLNEKEVKTALSQALEIMGTLVDRARAIRAQPEVDPETRLQMHVLVTLRDDLNCVLYIIREKGDLPLKEIAEIDVEISKIFDGINVSKVRFKDERLEVSGKVDKWAVEMIEKLAESME